MSNVKEEISAVLSEVRAITQTLSKQADREVDTVLQKIQETGTEFDVGLRMNTEGRWYERKVAQQLYTRWSQQYANLLFIEDPFDESEPHPHNDSVFLHPSNTVLLFSRYLASDVLRIGEWAALLQQNRHHTSSSSYGVCLKLSESGLVSDLVDAVLVSRHHSVPFLMVSLETDGFEGNTQTVVDIALGSGVDFLKIGPINSPSGSSAINHLLRLYYSFP
jgi:enolase